MLDHSARSVVSPFVLGPSCSLQKSSSSGSLSHKEYLYFSHVPKVRHTGSHLSFLSDGVGRKVVDCCRVSITERTTSLGSFLAESLRSLQFGRALPLPYVTSSFRVPINILHSSLSLMLTGLRAFLLIWSKARYPHHPPPGYSSSLGSARSETLTAFVLAMISLSWVTFRHWLRSFRSFPPNPSTTLTLRQPSSIDISGTAVSASLPSGFCCFLTLFERSLMAEFSLTTVDQGMSINLAPFHFPEYSILTGCSFEYFFLGHLRFGTLPTLLKLCL